MANPFLQCERSGRQWVYLPFVLLFGGASLYVLVAGVRKLLRESVELDASVILNLSFSGFWFLVMFGVTLILIWQLVANPHRVYRVDEHGVRMGRRLWRWEQIRRIRPIQSGENSGYFIFNTTGWNPLDRYMPSYPPLSNNELHVALEQIEAFLSKQHPNVFVG